MKKLLKTIIILGVIVLVLIIIIIILSSNTKSKNELLMAGIPETGSSITETVQKISVKSDYYMIQSCINVFYEYYQNLCNNVYGNTEELESIILQLLDKKYVKDFNVNSGNLREKIGDFKGYIIDINKIYVKQADNNISMYFVYGNFINKETWEIQNFALAVRIDALNKTFSILPFEYLKEKGYLDIKEFDKIKIDNIDNIEKNLYNAIQFKYINDETYIAGLLNQYKLREKYNPKAAWDLLDKDYREKRFGSIDNYIAYINSNSDYLSTHVTKYQKKEYSMYTEYTCVDNYDNYYIFKETSPMVYTTMLDLYTIDLPKFVTEYNNSADQQKVAFNIDKFIKGINNKNYRYSYNCLADSFKNNYFKTQFDFENYIRQELSGNYKVTYDKFKREGDLFTYSVNLIDKNTGQTIPKTFIIRLEEGTNFVLSFDR